MCPILVGAVDNFVEVTEKVSSYFDQCTDIGDRCVLGHIYNMKNQFWAVAYGVGWTVKKKGFLSFHGQFFFFFFLKIL